MSCLLDLRLWRLPSVTGRIAFPPHTPPCSRSQHSFCEELLKIAHLGSKRELAHHCLSIALERSPDWRLARGVGARQGSQTDGLRLWMMCRPWCSREQCASLQLPPRSQLLSPRDARTLGPLLGGQWRSKPVQDSKVEGGGRSPFSSLRLLAKWLTEQPVARQEV